MQEIDNLLLSVEKPVRYSGGEYNLPDMNKPHDTRFVMSFPDLYEVGMSNLGIRILYHMINDMEGVICERCFAPAVDMADKLKEYDIPLFTLETRTPLKDADIVGISVQFELLYSNVPYMLTAAKIPYLAKDRDDSYPLIVGGGPCMVNPEPLADFFDLFLIGEGEINVPPLIELYRKCKREGYNKADFLLKASLLNGVYVPSLMKTDIVDGKEVVVEGKVVKSVAKNLDEIYFPTKLIVPNMEIVHDRAVVELYRGCANGCRFCQAGFYYRPIRNRTPQKVLDIIKESIESTGYDEMNLSSLSTSDYCGISEIIPKLSKFAKEKHIRLALPSMRMDSYTAEYSESNRLSSLTFAPEAGTQRLRDVINKNITDEDINRSIILAFEQGYTSVKLYFMLGLPTETYEDLDGIVEIVERIKRLYQEHKVSKKFLSISLSTAVFIPKPLTPFQYEEQISLDETLKRQLYLRDKLRAIKGVRYSYHESLSSKLESVFARGDRRLGKVIATAFESGAKFDSWTEYFDYDNWVAAFNKCGIDMDEYTRAQNENLTMPWDFIDCGVTKKYLIKERRLAYEGKTTKSCISGCRGCGANRLEVCEQC